jgi:signal transduction histidine kinase/YHS domain-containing protein
MAAMAQHVQRAQAEGLHYRHALTDGQEAERARIAHELHDDTVQSLVAIAQSIELATNWIDTDAGRARTMLGLAREQAVESVNNLRRLIADLRPPALEELGIVAALSMMADEDEQHNIQVAVSGTPRRFGEAHELALFRIAQEAVRNAQRHGKASAITLHVTFQPREIELIVHDNGGGFSLPPLLDTLSAQSHFGLLGLQERVQQLGGAFSVSSQPGEGTTIRVILPLENLDQPAEAVIDPVCGALIQPQEAYGSVVYNDTRYYFCCPVCQGAFQRDPLISTRSHP